MRMTAHAMLNNSASSLLYSIDDSLLFQYALVFFTFIELVYISHKRTKNVCI